MVISSSDVAPRFEKILALVPSIIYVFDQKSQSNIYVNRPLVDLLGFTNAEAQEMGDAFFPNLCHPDDLPKVGAHMGAIQKLAEDEVISVEYRMRHKEGHWVWLLSFDTVFERDDDGSVRSHIGKAINISAQKNAEAQALHSQSVAEQMGAKHQRISELLSQIMNTAKSAIIGLDSDGRILSINSAGRDFLGGASQQTPFDWPDDIVFVDGETLENLTSRTSPVARAIAGEVLTGSIFLMARNDDRDVRYVRVSSAIVEAADAEIFCVLILDDVSEQEKNRQQVERTSRLDALGQLTGGIAHDFNNLLATVQYALELSEMVEGEARSNYIATAQQSIEQGSALTKRLLAFAKQQPGLSSSKEVERIVDDFRNLAAPLIEATITVDFEIHEPDLWVYCDAAQLDNALLNLLLNARDAILRSGVGNRIIVSVRGVNELSGDAALRREQPNTFIAPGLDLEQTEDDDRPENAAFRYVEFTVSDDGPGMLEEVKRRAIDPFFSTKSTNSGTGLGLSMVYGFIQQSGGELRLYSEQGQGTAIRMLLPRGTASGDREEPLERAEVPRGNGEAILIVEDEVNLAAMMKDVVSTLGYVVETVPHGKSALDRLAAGPKVDLVITDIVMPGGMDGFQLAQMIRETDPEMPIIYVSGYTGYSEKDMGEVVAPMLRKPCPPDLLASAIDTTLQAGGKLTLLDDT